MAQFDFVPALLVVIAVELLWVGLKIHNKLYFIHHRQGVMLDMLRILSHIDQKLVETNKSAEGLRQGNEQIIQHICSLHDAHDRLDDRAKNIEDEHQT